MKEDVIEAALKERLEAEADVAFEEYRQGMPVAWEQMPDSMRRLISITYKYAWMCGVDWAESSLDAMLASIKR